VAVTFTPYLGVKLLPHFKARTEQGNESEGHEKLGHESTTAQYQSAGYQRLRQVITWCVTRRKRVVLITLLALLVSIGGMVGPVEKAIFPEL